MSKDEALKLWLNAELPRYLSEDHVGPFRYVAADAWRAAVAHTLAFVAARLLKKSAKATGHEASRLRQLVGDIKQMKP